MTLKKDLGLLEVFCISSGAMISSGLFILIALAYVKTGPSLIISYAIASLLVLPTVLSKSELVTALPRTGGDFVFTDRGMGPIAGTLAGLAAWFSLAFKTAFALLGMGIFITLFNPDISDMNIKIIAVACCLFFMVINLWGVKITAQFQSIMVLALFVLLGVYVVAGSFFVKHEHFYPFMPNGFGAMLSTAGFVFIAFAGMTKIASVAGEVKNPQRNLPLGVILSWALVSCLYLIVIYITVGILKKPVFEQSLLPVSVGGSLIMGNCGLVIMSFAGLLAFITTGNAGILAASRTPMAMSKAGLLPLYFNSVSRRGTPWIAIIFTSLFMITIMLCIDFELFVKTASTLKLILFTISNLSVIFLRRGKSRFYKPTFKSPFYPWIQIAAVITYTFLIIDMGLVPILITFAFALCGMVWYFFYAHLKVVREYKILRVIKKIANLRSKGYMFDEEFREVFVARDCQGEARFQEKIKECLFLDIKSHEKSRGIYRKIAADLSERLNIEAELLYNQILSKKNSPSILGSTAVIFLHIRGSNLFEIALVRSQEEAVVRDEFPSIPATIVIAASFDQANFYIRALKWIVQITRNVDFEKKWMKAKNIKALRKVFLDVWRERRMDYKEVCELT
ncbi:MAG: amino acid permease [bacterium]|nr:amino acid permease [bacterium]